MPRGLDHIVHAVSDLDGAAEVYRQLGFTVGARNRHPWGTHNHIVQLPGFFIELLTLAEPDKMSGDVFSTMFAAYNRDFVARGGDGLSMLVLESNGAAADEAAFRSAGIAAAPATRFDRDGKKPDGTPVKVAFTLAFAKDKQAPDASFFICQQHYPENFWNPAFQQHSNGVRGIAGVVLVADEPAQHREFLTAFTGATARDDGEGFAIDLPRGAIGVMTPSAFTDRFGQRPPVTERGARLAALRFKAADPAAVGAMLEGAGIWVTPLKAGAISAAVLGATLVFEPAP